MNAGIVQVSRQEARFLDKLKRHQAFWNRAEQGSLLRSDGVFAASLPVHLPQADGTTVAQAERLTADMVDPVAMIAEVERWSSGTPDPHLLAHWQAVASLGLGDALPFSQPFFKIPWLEAMLGCPITMTEGDIWVNLAKLPW